MRLSFLLLLAVGASAARTLYLGGGNHGHNITLSDLDEQALMNGGTLKFKSNVTNGHAHLISVVWASCDEFVVVASDLHPHWALPQNDDGMYFFNQPFPDVTLNFTALSSGMVAEHAHSATFHLTQVLAGQTLTVHTTSATPADDEPHTHAVDIKYLGCDMFATANQVVEGTGAPHTHFYTVWRPEGMMMPPPPPAGGKAGKGGMLPPMIPPMPPMDDGKAGKGQPPIMMTDAPTMAPPVTPTMEPPRRRDAEADGKGAMPDMTVEPLSFEPFLVPAFLLSHIVHVELTDLAMAWSNAGDTNVPWPVGAMPHSHEVELEWLDLLRLGSGDIVSAMSSNTPNGPPQPPPTKGMPPMPPATHNHSLMLRLAGCGDLVVVSESSVMGLSHVHDYDMMMGGKGGPAPPMPMPDPDEVAWAGNYSWGQTADASLVYGSEAIAMTHSHTFNLTFANDMSLRAGQTVRVTTLPDGTGHQHTLDLKFWGCGKWTYDNTHDPAKKHSHLLFAQAVNRDRDPEKAAKMKAKKEMAIGVGVGVGGAVLALGAAAVLIKRSRRTTKPVQKEEVPLQVTV